MEFRETTVYYVLGVMSGTSVDGIDLAYVKLEKEKNWHFKILRSEALSYTKDWQKRLREAINYSSDRLAKFDTEYTAYLADRISFFIQEYSIEKLDAVASHGHTILHRPEDGITYQIGNKSELARLIGKRVICDFRIQDVQFGGQGAPLVPIGDQHLFKAYDACINIGGFANISYNYQHERIAYDICPTNIVLNKYAEILGQEYDMDGGIAASSPIDEKLLKRLNDLAFYNQKPPKSLGLEWVIEQIFPILEASTCTAEIIIATFTEHMAVQIAHVIDFIESDKPKVLFTGGGAYNKHLVKRINELVTVEIVVPDKDLIEFKEALIFAFMGALRLRNTTNVLSSVTGAKEDHCSGVIYTP